MGQQALYGDEETQAISLYPPAGLVAALDKEVRAWNARETTGHANQWTRSNVAVALLAKQVRYPLPKRAKERS